MICPYCKHWMDWRELKFKLWAWYCARCHYAAPVEQLVQSDATWCNLVLVAAGDTLFAPTINSQWITLVIDLPSSYCLASRIRAIWCAVVGGQFDGDNRVIRGDLGRRGIRAGCLKYVGRHSLLVAAKTLVTKVFRRWLRRSHTLRRMPWLSRVRSAPLSPPSTSQICNFRRSDTGRRKARGKSATPQGNSFPWVTVHRSHLVEASGSSCALASLAPSPAPRARARLFQTWRQLVCPAFA